MKRFLIAIALSCLLSVSVMAGDVPIVPAPSPAPGPITSEPSVVTTAPADIPSVGLSLSLVTMLLELAF